MFYVYIICAALTGFSLGCLIAPKRLDFDLDDPS